MKGVKLMRVSTGGELMKKELLERLIKVVGFTLMAAIGLLAAGLMIVQMSLTKPDIEKNAKLLVCAIMTAIMWIGYVKLLQGVS
jgi:hypothetical protein